MASVASNSNNIHIPFTATVWTICLIIVIISHAGYNFGVITGLAWIVVIVGVIGFIYSIFR